MLLQEFPQDSGPIYLETVEGRFPIEPFNTYSNLIFSFLIIYWGIKVYKNPKQHQFLAWVLPIIGTSYIGGTIYHATRSREFWLRLDWMPIMLLCAAWSSTLFLSWLNLGGRGCSGSSCCSGVLFYFGCCPFHLD